MVNLHIHHGGYFIYRKNMVYEETGCLTIREFDEDKMSYFELLGYVKDLGYNCDDINFYYCEPNMSLDCGLRCIKNDDDALKLLHLSSGVRDIHTYCVSKLLALHASDDINSNQNTSGKVGQSQDKEPNSKVTPKKPKKSVFPKKVFSPKSPKPISKANKNPLTLEPLHSSPLPSTPKTTKSHLSEPLTNPISPIPLSIEHPSSPLPRSEKGTTKQAMSPKGKTFLEEYEFEDPRPDSPIPWNELIYGDLITDSSDDSEYHPEDEIDFDDPSCSKVVRKRKAKKHVDEEYVSVSDEYMDEDTDIEDVETSDDEWKEVKEKVEHWRKMGNKVVEDELIHHEQPIEEMVNPINNVDMEISEYENTEEEMESLDEEDEEVGSKILRKKKRAPRVGKGTNYKTLKWVVGMRFATVEQFREAITMFALSQGYDLKYKVALIEKKKFKVVCRENCNFHVYLSSDKKKQNYVVKSVGTGHKCTRNMSKNTQLKSSWMASHYLQNFKETPALPAKEVILLVKKEFGICITQWLAYKVKQKSGRLLHGSMRDHYSKLGRYIEELKRSNPSSIFIMETNPKMTKEIPAFQRFFVCFDALRNGLVNGCRRVLCIDAGFLKTFLGGTLLSAIGVDGNNQMFPVTWALAEGENNDSWQWFLTQLRSCIGSTDGSGWTIISDQHKAILHGVSVVLPSSEHRNCARHIYANWKKVHKGDELKELFWIAARAYNEIEYNIALCNLKFASVKGAVDFEAQNPKSFCRAFVKTESRCDYVVNNMAETFNAYIVKARSKHLIFMLEDIRMALMQRVYLKREAMEKSEDDILPRIRAKLEKERHEARQCVAMVSDNLVFEVEHSLEKLRVDMVAHTCTCGRWELTGIPCCHAICCAIWLGKPAEEYVNPYLTRSMYMRAYEGDISPCLGEKHWPTKDMPLDPPEVKIGPGRPKKMRRRDPHEDPKRPGKLTRHGREMTCTFCKRIGHNVRTCAIKKNNVHASTTNASIAHDFTAVPARGRATRGMRRHVSQDQGEPLHDSASTTIPTRGRGRASRGAARGGRGIGRAARGSNRGLYGWFTAGQRANEQASTSGQHTSVEASNPEIFTQESLA